MRKENRMLIEVEFVNYLFGQLRVKINLQQFKKEKEKGTKSLFLKIKNFNKNYGSREYRSAIN